MKQFSESQTATHTATINGVNIFYREAGDASKPTIVLLHGFPSSSHEFRELIPLLAGRFHVIAPDYPGMGYSDAPAPTVLRPTFDDVAMVIDAFIAQCAPGPVILYLYDIGGAIGLRVAMAHPERIAGLIFQNVTITQEGWNPERLKFYEWVGGSETPEKLAAVEKLATEARDKYLHKTGAHQPDALNPDNWAIDAHAFSIPESRTFMSRLLMDMKANFPQYPKWGRLSEGAAAEDARSLGAKRPFLHAGGHGSLEAGCADSRSALFRWRPLRARRIRRRVCPRDHRDVLPIGYCWSSRS